MNNMTANFAPQQRKRSTFDPSKYVMEQKEKVDKNRRQKIEQEESKMISHNNARGGLSRKSPPPPNADIAVPLQFGSHHQNSFMLAAQSPYRKHETSSSTLMNHGRFRSQSELGGGQPPLRNMHTRSSSSALAQPQYASLAGSVAQRTLINELTTNKKGILATGTDKNRQLDILAEINDYTSGAFVVEAADDEQPLPTPKGSIVTNEDSHKRGSYPQTTSERSGTAGPITAIGREQHSILIREQTFIDSLSRGVLRGNKAVHSSSNEMRQHQMHLQSMNLPMDTDEAATQGTHITPRDYRHAMTVQSLAGCTTTNNHMMESSQQDFTEPNKWASVALGGDEHFTQSQIDYRIDTETTQTIKLDDLLNETSSALKIDTQSWLKNDSDVLPSLRSTIQQNPPSSTDCQPFTNGDLVEKLEPEIKYPDHPHGAMVQANVQLFQNFPVARLPHSQQISKAEQANRSKKAVRHQAQNFQSKISKLISSPKPKAPLGVTSVLGNNTKAQAIAANRRFIRPKSMNKHELNFNSIMSPTEQLDATQTIDQYESTMQVQDGLEFTLQSSQQFKDATRCKSTLFSRTLEEGQLQEEKKKISKSVKNLNKYRPQTTTNQKSSEFLLGGNKRTKPTAAVRSRHVHSQAGDDVQTIGEVDEERLAKKPGDSASHIYSKTVDEERLAKKSADSASLIWSKTTLTNQGGKASTKNEDRISSLTPKGKMPTPTGKKSIKKFAEKTTISPLNQTKKKPPQKQEDLPKIDEPPLRAKKKVEDKQTPVAKIQQKPKSRSISKKEKDRSPNRVLVAKQKNQIQQQPTANNILVVPPQAMGGFYQPPKPGTLKEVVKPSKQAMKARDLVRKANEEQKAIAAKSSSKNGNSSSNPRQKKTSFIQQSTKLNHAQTLNVQVRTTSKQRVHPVEDNLARPRQVTDLQMLDRQNDPSSRRLRLSEKDPHGDDTLGMMPPTDLGSSQRVVTFDEIGKVGVALPNLPWKNNHESLPNDLNINKDDSIELVNLNVDDHQEVAMLQESIGSKKGAKQAQQKAGYAYSDEQIEVDFFGEAQCLDDSFDTNRMNAQDSVASELDFNNENASIADDSDDENVGKNFGNPVRVDMNHVVNLKDLRKQKQTKPAAHQHQASGRATTAALQSKIRAIQVQEAHLMDNLHMKDASFQQRVLSRLMEAQKSQKEFLFSENTLTIEKSSDANEVAEAYADDREEVKLGSEKKMQTQKLPNISKQHKDEMVLSSDTFQPKNHNFSPASFFNSPSLDQKTALENIQKQQQQQPTTSPFISCIEENDETAFQQQSHASDAFFGGESSQQLLAQTMPVLSVPSAVGNQTMHRTEMAIQSQIQHSNNILDEFYNVSGYRPQQKPQQQVQQMSQRVTDEETQAVLKGLPGLILDDSDGDGIEELKNKNDASFISQDDGRKLLVVGAARGNSLEDADSPTVSPQQIDPAFLQISPSPTIEPSYSSKVKEFSTGNSQVHANAPHMREQQSNEQILNATANSIAVKSSKSSNRSLLMHKPGSKKSQSRDSSKVGGKKRKRTPMSRQRDASNQASTTYNDRFTHSKQVQKHARANTSGVDQQDDDVEFGAMQPSMFLDNSLARRH